MKHFCKSDNFIKRYTQEVKGQVKKKSW